MSLEAVMRWVASDESNSAKIELSATNAAYGEDEELDLSSIGFQVELAEFGRDPDVLHEGHRQNPVTFVVHQGFGDTIEEACVEALRMRSDWLAST